MNFRPARETAASLVAVSLLALLTACSPAVIHPAVEPITVSANRLQGTTVHVPLDSELDINTGSLSVTSYSGTVSDAGVAKFIPGKKTSTAEFNPGLQPLAVGETTVTLKNRDGGIQDITFTLDVTK